MLRNLDLNHHFFHLEFIFLHGGSLETRHDCLLDHISPSFRNKVALVTKKAILSSIPTVGVGLSHRNQEESSGKNPNLTELPLQVAGLCPLRDHSPAVFWVAAPVPPFAPVAPAGSLLIHRLTFSVLPRSGCSDRPAAERG